MKGIGLHAHRLAPEQNNEREVAFVKQWREEESFHTVLESLMFKQNPTDGFGSLVRKGAFPIGKPTKRDRIIAETIIQWLGSNVGMCFIGLALKRCGKKITNVVEGV